MLDAKNDLRPDNERDVRCVNHPERRGTFLRRMVNGAMAPICAACWREDHIQGPITTDRELIERAPLTPEERAILIPWNRSIVYAPTLKDRDGLRHVIPSKDAPAYCGAVGEQEAPRDWSRAEICPRCLQVYIRTVFDLPAGWGWKK